MVGIMQADLLMRVIGYDPSGDQFIEQALSSQQYIESSLFGLLFGSFFFVINRLTDHPRIHSRSFGQVILIRSALYLVGLFGVGFLIYSIMRLSGVYTPEVMERWSQLDYGIEVFVPMLLLMAFFVLLSNYVLATARKIGPGFFMSMFTGRYHRPITENRIFLFIDLKGSTGIAEQLGHIRYSMLIQDCFRELDYVIYKYRAQIYQYVGDEAVLSWEARDGLKNNRCLHLYFAFADRLKRKSDFFEQKYGVVPFFKAGLNIGEVTVAEFGNIKREIAYHGDVMNTASRIQNLCNLYGKRLLISRPLHDALPPDPKIRMEALGTNILRGKMEKIEIYAVEREEVPFKPVGSSKPESPRLLSEAS